MTILKKCPKCGNLDDKNFCYRDGAKMVDVLTCKNCGWELIPAYKFCPKCGTEVK